MGILDQDARACGSRARTVYLDELGLSFAEAKAYRDPIVTSAQSESSSGSPQVDGSTPDEGQNV